ncbi:LLM class flavin-dependent oxidoreductase [Streptomyces sp. CBMA156]|uniref:LLM class flavin-dependent oxidoreductase n=1 Tax=Streptomyces sp. CBMA156 TaxID=1930280 RepID=UPI001662156D|nr:LLM class flavin-dependent oxidoreductase [Streptomyces sp. CBMA156]MBD0672842.1 alkanesulfonate monooxygenase [Streptomyces sp. CBMA156]MBD0675807.1 alkanesulfonate monooxygenase [Streptomyces sp. CBMA156]
MQFHWFLPTGADGRTLTTGMRGTHGPGHDTATSRVPGSDRHRAPDLRYLTQIAQAAEHLGFDAILTPAGTFNEDPWITCAALAQTTERLKFLVALRPDAISPTLAAQMAATFQGQSRGRLLLNIVTGGDPAEQARFGDHLGKAARYARTDEWLTVLRGAWSPEPFDHSGAHYDVRGAAVFSPPDPMPGVYFGGSSDEALPVAVRHADVHLTWGEPPADVAARLERIRELAAHAGRSVPRFGIRFHTVARDTAAQAWAAAERLLTGIDPEHVARVQTTLAGSQSTGQARQSGLSTAYRHSARTSDLEVHPNVWAGVGLLRGGAGTALVGSHQEVADRIAEYAALGIEEFILSGIPHLEEAYEVGEGVLPLLGADRAVAVGR